MKIIAVIFTFLLANNLVAQDLIALHNENSEHKSPDYSSLIKNQKSIEQTTSLKDSIHGTNPRWANRFGVNFNVGGPSIVGSISFDYFITSSINVEAGVGYIGFFSGIKYHLEGKKVDRHWTPYVGLYAVRIPELRGDFKLDGRNGLYMPLGVQYMSNFGITIGAEFARIAIESIANDTKYWGALKVGYHF
ncbi:MAG: hypothetical protein ACJAY8_001028 [Sphingobacteriales bacterium]|jgi:hypothetical protein